MTALDRPGDPELISAADVTPVPVVWLWPGWLPAGKLVLIDGNPGQGKTTIALDLVARLTTGTEMPTGGRSEPQRALLLCSEDGYDDTIRPRLDTAGANPDLVDLWKWESPFPEFPRRADWLETQVRERGVGLVVIDPLMAFLAAEVNSNRDQDVRRALTPIAHLAKRTGTTVLAVRHLNKSSGSPAMYRGTGSIAFTGLARMTWLTARHPSAEETMVLSQVKNSLARESGSLRYRIVERDGNPMISWEGPCDLSADEVIDAATIAQGRLAQASHWLGGVLASGPMRVTELKTLAAQAGFSEKTVERAKTAMGVGSDRVGDHWEWSLPG